MSARSLGFMEPQLKTQQHAAEVSQAEVLKGHRPCSIAGKVCALWAVDVRCKPHHGTLQLSEKDLGNEAFRSLTF